MEDETQHTRNISLTSVWKSFALLAAVGYLIILLFYRQHRFSHMVNIWQFDGMFFETAYGIAAGLLFACIVIFLYKIGMLDLPDNVYTELMKNLLQKKHGIFTIACGAGISEEILFRGALLGVLKTYIGELSALIFVSVIFMILHIPQYKGNILIHIIVLCMGIVLGGLFLWTGALWAPISAHIVYNGFIAVVMRKKFANK